MPYQNLNEVLLINIGLLAIRLAVGLTFAGHGCQKLFGWFGGAGPVGFSMWLESIGIKSGARAWGIFAGLFELIGGLLLATGLFTVLGAALIIIVMIDAIIAVHGRNGYWADKGGFEYNFILIVVVLGVALIGPGAYVFM